MVWFVCPYISKLLNCCVCARAGAGVCVFICYFNNFNKFQIFNEDALHDILIGIRSFWSVSEVNLLEAMGVTTPTQNR